MFNPCLKLIYKILELQSLSISRDHNLTSLKQGWFSRINVNIQKEETDKLAKKKKKTKQISGLGQEMRICTGLRRQQSLGISVHIFGLH